MRSEREKKKKKIIIGVVAICTTIVLHAANVDWSIDYSYLPGTSDPAAGYSAFFFDNDIYAATVAKSALASGDTSFISTYGHAANDVADEDGYYDGSVSGYGNGVTVNGYVVLLDSATSPTLAYVTDVLSGSTKSSGLPANIAFGDLTGTQNASAWTSVAAPEPTSGLLLLLGMAGLALRRKRA